MIAVEVNGQRVEVETEREARRVLSKALKDARKLELAHQAQYQTARLKADAAGYRLLQRRAAAEDFPHGWRFYRPGDKWAEHLFQPTDSPERTRVNAQDATGAGFGITIDHYGNRLVGGICNGSGYCFALFLRDRDKPESKPVCCAIGVEGEAYALAECPGIEVDHFKHTEEV